MWKRQQDFREEKLQRNRVNPIKMVETLGIVSIYLIYLLFYNLDIYTSCFFLTTLHNFDKRNHFRFEQVLANASSKF